jgi:hypothetical protein
LAHQLGSAGRALVETRFSREQFATSVNALYADFLEA